MSRYDAAEYPRAERLAAELLAMPALLALRSRRLVCDLMAARGCGLTTARRAVGFARRWSRA